MDLAVDLTELAAWEEGCAAAGEADKGLAPGTAILVEADVPAAAAEAAKGVAPGKGALKASGVAAGGVVAVEAGIKPTE